MNRALSVSHSAAARIAIIIALALVASASQEIFALRPSRFDRGAPALKIRLAVMAGPSAFSTAGLDQDRYEMEVLKSPADAVARLLSSETDLAILPAHLCFLLMQKGAGVKILAVTGEGRASVIVRSGDGDFGEFPDRVFVPSKGSTLDFMVGWLYPDAQRDYSMQAPEQLAAAFMAGKADAVALPEPYRSIVTRSDPSVRVLRDLHEDFRAKTGLEGFVMSVLVARGGFSENAPALAARILDDFDASLGFALGDSESAAKMISGFGFISEADALATIRESGICLRRGEDAKEECGYLYSIAREQNPGAFVKASLEGCFLEE